MVRLAKLEDLDEIMKIYEYARNYMKEHGNPTQWGENRPSRDTIEKDIKNQNAYVLYDGNELYGIFSLIYGDDETYEYIYEGSWISNTPYATFHRIASNGTKKGVFKECVAFGKEKYSHLRIDTHENNKIMQNSILNQGFKYCGIIYVLDGSSRLAYEYVNI